MHEQDQETTAKMKLFHVIVCLSGLFAFGCASHTPRQVRAPRPPAPTKGVSAYAPDKFRVTYDGGRRTAPQVATDYAMLRAADVTLQHGYSYFVLLNQSDSTSSRSYTTPLSANIDHYGAQTITSVYGGDTITSRSPHTSLMIQTYTNNVEGSLDAAWLKQSLFTQYRLKSTP